MLPISGDSQNGIIKERGRYFLNTLGIIAETP
jgi:hypothetical protein